MYSPLSSNDASVGGFEMARAKQIFQFRLCLVEVRPPVWRRIQIPADCTLARLHKVVQALMDWQDYHLHEFTVAGRAYGVPDPEDERQVVDERTVQLRDLGLSIGDRLEYVYDLGDNWEHVLELEEQMPGVAGTIYPVCIGGERSAPPEDVGGVSGYEEFLDALSDPDHEEHEHMKAWVGRPFNPAAFSLAQANERLRKKLRLGKRP